MPAEVARERELRAWKLRTEDFWTQQRIADELGVDQSTVCKMLARISKRYLKAIESQVEDRKAEQILQLEQIASEARAAWEKSLQDAQESGEVTVEETEQTENGCSKKTKTTTSSKTKGQAGDARHLQVAMQALGDIRKILGIDAPQKQEHSGTLQTVSLTLDQWQKQAAERRAKVEETMSAFEDGDGE